MEETGVIALENISRSHLQFVQYECSIKQHIKMFLYFHATLTYPILIHSAQDSGGFSLKTSIKYLFIQEHGIYDAD